MEKITKRKMFEVLYEMAGREQSAVGDQPVCDTEVTPQMIMDFCQKEIESLDKKALKAKERAAKKAKEGDELTQIVQGLLTDEYQTIPAVAEQVAEVMPDATVAKVQYRLVQLAKEGFAQKDEITIPATETSKTRHVMGYRLAEVSDEQ